jgi:hypothetical protein
MNRNSLTYSFLPGDSLWTDKHTPVQACEGDSLGSSQPHQASCLAFLNNNLKAHMQWTLEHKLSLWLSAMK